MDASTEQQTALRHLAGEDGDDFLPAFICIDLLISRVLKINKMMMILTATPCNTLLQETGFTLKLNEDRDLRLIGITASQLGDSERKMYKAKAFSARPMPNMLAVGPREKPKIPDWISTV